MSGRPDLTTLIREGLEHHAAMTGCNTPGGPGWRAGTYDTHRLFFPDPNGIAGPYSESCLLLANKHFPNHHADLHGVAWMRNHLLDMIQAIQSLTVQLADANQTIGEMATAGAIGLDD